MKQTLSLALRAVLAVTLMIGFYGLALGIVAVLLGFVYLDVSSGGIHVKGIIGCVLISGLVVHAVFPRPDRFEQPGPRLNEAEQPRLFAQLRAVAEAAGQAMPAEVYAVDEVNAAVTQRGGFMGFGSRRVMILGVPLMQALTVSQLRAVIAHEFGHFHGGDVRLGPWTYKTRNALGRTIRHLSEAESWLVYPFRWYGALFLRVTHALSRRQELSADALAARVVGSEHMIRGLEATYRAHLAYASFWKSDCVPLLSLGRRPPIYPGFAAFLASHRLVDALHDAAEEEKAGGAADPYDTHPPLRDRINAVRGICGSMAADDRPSISLLSDLDRLERALLAFMTDWESVDRLEAVGWEEAGSEVYAKLWREVAAQHGAPLRGMKPGDIPREPDELASLGERLLGPRDSELTADALTNFALDCLGKCLAAAMVQAGWQVEALPGHPFRLVRGDQAFEMFLAVHALAAGELSRADWRRQCAALAIDDLDLGALARDGGAEPGTSSTRLRPTTGAAIQRKSRSG